MPTSVSIVVVNYNGGPGVVENLRAVSAQAATPGWELIVVDSCSTDGSRDRITDAGLATRLVRESVNRGYASAVNRGLREASGDVVVVMNADVVPRPGALEVLAGAVDANRRVALVGGVLLDGEGRPSPNTARAFPRPMDILREALARLDPDDCARLAMRYLAGFNATELAAVTGVTIFGYIAFSLLVTEWRIKYRREMNERDTEANTKAIDSLLNFETVKYFGNEAHESRRYDGALRMYERAAIRSKISLAMLNIGQAGIIAIGLVALNAMAALGVIAGTLTVGDFVLVNAYLMQLYMPLNFLGFVYRQIRQSLTDMDAMYGLLKVDREIADKPDAPALAVNGGEIVFDSVNFGYDERRPILRDVSFTVPPGKTVAIVGPSGAGKSTISRILFRFYDVAEGAVRIDGQDIRDVTQESLRACIGIVPQDTVLFNDTIYYNVAYGRPDASPAEIEEAARMARIHDFVMGMPDGYQTRVGERGLKLSGGEKQRVAIARTILKQPAILLFDEATSALDTHTEQEIQKSLDEVSANRTTLVIAHRLSTVVGADEIIVLDQGRICERGRHAELLTRDGPYAAMWKRQQEGRNGGDEAGDIVMEPGPAPVAG